MIARVVQAVSGMETAVIVNPVYGPAVEAALRERGFRGEFILQFRRSGSAEAVRTAISLLQAEHALVVYGDMPLWSAETVESLVRLYERTKPVLALATVALDGNSPAELRRYGRVIRDAAGEIVRVVEPADAQPEELAAASVNPSLFIWEAGWFLRNVRRVSPVAKADGREPERYIPPLIGILRREGGRIAELPLANPLEALGVNNAYELERVRRIVDVGNGEAYSAGRP